MLSQIERLKEKYRNMHGYKILHDGQMEKAVIKMEKNCPVCGYDHVTYIDKEEYHNRHQYLYRCQRCGSQWQGMRYNREYDVI